jgi:hypothetical protein
MTSPELQHLIAQLRFSRLRNNKAATVVARRLGVDVKTFYLWEAGSVDIPASQLLTWAELVGKAIHPSRSNSKSMLVDHDGSLWLPGKDATSTLVTGARSWEVAESIVHTFTGIKEKQSRISEYVKPVRIGQNHAKSIDGDSWNYSEASETGVQYAVNSLDSDRQWYAIPSVCWRVVVVDLDRLTESDWTCFSEMAQSAVAQNWHVLAVSVGARPDRRAQGFDSHIRAGATKIQDQVGSEWSLKRPAGRSRNDR